MKKLIIMMIFLSSICWSASFKVGFSKNYQYFKDYNGFQDNGATFSLGMGFQFDIFQNISFNFETLINMDSYSNKFLYDHYSSYVSVPETSVEIPIYAEIKTGKYINLYFGAYVWLPMIKSSVSVDYKDNVDEHLDVEYRDSLLGGLIFGIKIPVNNISFDFRYKYGIYSYYENIDVTDHNFCLSFDIYF